MEHGSHGWHEAWAAPHARTKPTHRILQDARVIMPEDGISAVKYNGTALLSQQCRIGRAQLGPCMWVKLCVFGGSARMHAHERMSAY